MAVIQFANDIFIQQKSQFTSLQSELAVVHLVSGTVQSALRSIEQII